MKCTFLLKFINIVVSIIGVILFASLRQLFDGTIVAIVPGSRMCNALIAGKSLMKKAAISAISFVIVGIATAE